MVELTQNMNDTLMKSQNSSDSSFMGGGNMVNAMKWKNLNIKYIKQIKTLEAAIFQKQKELDRLSQVKQSSAKKGTF